MTHAHQYLMTRQTKREYSNSWSIRDEWFTKEDLEYIEWEHFSKSDLDYILNFT